MALHHNSTDIFDISHDYSHSNSLTNSLLDNFYVSSLNSLKFIYTNAESLRSKIDELRSVSEEVSPDIIVVVETWLTSEILDSEISIEGYNIVRSSSLNEIRSGICFYVRINPNIFYESCDILDNFDFRESLWIWVTNFNDGKKYLFGAIYRKSRHINPLIDTNENNSQLINLLSQAVTLANHNLMILGDFNLKHIDWSTSYINSHDNYSQVFLDHINYLCLKQHVMDFTRFRGSDQPSCLDLIFTPNTHDISDLQILPPLGMGDHCCLVFNYNMNVAPKPTRRIDSFNFNQADWSSLNSYFLNSDWSIIYTSNNIETSYTRFLDLYNHGVLNYIPTKHVNKNTLEPPWFNNHVKSAIRQKLFSFKRFAANRTLRNHQSYIHKRNLACRKIKIAKKRYEDYITQNLSSNSKAFFKYIRKNKNPKSGIPQLKKPDGTLTSNDYETAHELNRYFQSVLKNESIFNEHEFTVNDHNNSHSLNDVYFSPTDVLSILLNLDCFKSVGPDSVHNYVLKKCANSLFFPLFCIFRLSMDTGLLPAVWKTSNITAIHKKGCKNLASNYRPISLTSLVCKIFEKIIKNCITSYFQRFSLIRPNQHGFLSNKSCFTNLLETLEDWTHWFDMGYEFDVIFLDFKRAFDLVPHKRLIFKCKNIGIGGKLLTWLQSFLLNRFQRVIFNGISTDWKQVTSGVPQGSILGPTLFLIFINDLPSIINSTSKLFADDGKIYNFMTDVLQNDLFSISDWAQIWDMEFNFDKCGVLHFGRHNDMRTYAFGDNNVLSTISYEKDLGITHDGTLLYKKHIDDVKRKFNQALGVVSRTFSVIDQKIFPLIYNSYLRPHIDYCAQLWWPFMQGDLQSLEKLQRKATKKVLGLRNVPYEDRLTILNMTSLSQRRQKYDMIEVYKIMNGYTDINSSNFFHLRNNSTLRGHTQHLTSQRCHTNIRQNFFTQRIISQWNRLPQNLVNSQSIAVFKRNYDLFMQNAYTS